MDACVNTSIWCDGVNHCPSGYDESFTHCSALLKLPAEILAALCVALILVGCGAIFWAIRWDYNFSLYLSVRILHKFSFSSFLFIHNTGESSVISAAHPYFKHDWNHLVPWIRLRWMRRRWLADITTILCDTWKSIVSPRCDRLAHRIVLEPTFWRWLKNLNYILCRVTTLQHNISIEYIHIHL